MDFAKNSPDSALHMAPGSVQVEHQEAAVQRFRHCVESLVEFGRAEGVELAAYDDVELPLFRSCPMEVQAVINDSLETYVSVLASVREQKQPVRHSHSGAWAMLGHLKWRHHSELFSRLESTDVVEIYAVNGIQLFRSFHFFELCSYTLEELFTTPWFDLFQRDPEIDRMHLDMHNDLINGRVRGIEVRPIPPYIVREKFGRRRLVNRGEFRLISPLFEKSGAVVGYVHALRATLVGADL